ncbi:bacterial extracellular solute-binding s, 3 family protein, partial [Vibrio harveyi]
REQALLNVSCIQCWTWKH